MAAASHGAEHQNADHIQAQPPQPPHRARLPGRPGGCSSRWTRWQTDCYEHTQATRVQPRRPLGIDASLSSDEIAVRDTVRKFCAEHVIPYIAEWFEIGDLPVRQLGKQFGQLGLLGMHLEGYGCGGSSSVHYGLACTELEAADSGIRSMVSVQGSLAMFAIWNFGSEEQKQQWLPGMAAGELLGCFGLTEPDAGSDPRR